MESRMVKVGSFNTHYWEAGRGDPVVLLHGGDFGGRAENSWEYNMPAISRYFRVVAPDWLGFGRTDKVYDFVQRRQRMIDHMAEFLEVMGLQSAHMVANSMGATILCEVVARRDPRFRPASIVLCSGGGFVPDNEYRRALVEYDCTREGMIRILKAIFEDSYWWTDNDYVERRLQWSLEAGVWEAAAAARFRAPHLPDRGSYGHADTIPYEDITCPTLIVAGREDKLRLPGYSDELARRIQQARHVVFDRCGHCPNIERHSEFNSAVLDFLGSLNSAEAS